MEGPARPDKKAAVQVRLNLLKWAILYLVLIAGVEGFGVWTVETDPSNAGRALYVMILAPVVAILHGLFRFQRGLRFNRLASGVEDTLVDGGVVKGLPVLFFANGLWAEQLVVPVDPTEPSTEFGKRITENRRPEVAVLVFRAAYDSDRLRVPVPRPVNGTTPLPRNRSEVVDLIPAAGADKGLTAALTELNRLMGVPAGTLYMREWKEGASPVPSFLRWVCEYEVPFEDRFLYPDAIERELIDIANVLDQVCRVCGRSERPPPPNGNAAAGSGT